MQHFEHVCTCVRDYDLILVAFLSNRSDLITGILLPCSIRKFTQFCLLFQCICWLIEKPVHMSGCASQN